MSKPYSEADFSAQITDDRTWRLKEISDLKSASKTMDQNLRRVLLRALITICYAHWEGHVRFCARKYLEHIALRGIEYNDLDRQFLRNYFLPRLTALSHAKTSLSSRCALIDDILDASDRPFTRLNEDLVNTKSNLSFDVFSDICQVCSVPISVFADKANFIDLFLLKRRNAIAHGEETFVSIEDLDDLTTNTVEIMRTFGDVLENHIVLKDYRYVRT